MQHMQSAPPGQSCALRLTGACLPLCIALCVSCMRDFQSLLPKDSAGMASSSEAEFPDDAQALCMAAAHTLLA